MRRPPEVLAALICACVIGVPATAGVLPPFARPATTHASRASSPSRPTAVPLGSTNADGSWHEQWPHQTWDALGIYDADDDALITVGDYRSWTWELSLGGAPVWQPLAMTPTLYVRPNQLARDPTTGLVYYADFTGPNLEIRTLDPHSGITTPVLATNPAPMLIPGSLVFDPVSQRLLLMGAGNFDVNPPEVVWALDLLPSPTWSQLSPGGTPPPPGIVANSWAMIDPTRHRLVFPISGPPDSTNVWELTLDGPIMWEHYAFSNPSPPHDYLFFDNPFVLDPVTGNVWTLDHDGGAWALSLQTHQWSLVVPPGAGPTGRYACGLALDSPRHRLLTFGGTTHLHEDVHNDAWALTLDGPPAWTELVHDVTRLGVRGGAADAFDTARNRMIVFGGSGDDGGGFRNDTWALELGTHPQWHPVGTQGSLPPGRSFHSAAWDPVRDQLVTFGGYDGSLTALADLWTLSCGGDPPTWTQLSPSGSAPPGRAGANLVYDSKRDRFLLLLGYGSPNYLSDVWELRLSPMPTWRPLTPAGMALMPRAGAMAVYDALRDRVLVFGGGNDESYFSDVWALDFGVGDGTWHPLAIPPGPSARDLALFRYDDHRDRLLLFGGYGVSHQEPGLIYVDYLNDLWSLDLTGTPAWQSLAPQGISPFGRDRANGAYDPMLDRLVMACGGLSGSNDTWLLDFGDVPTPTLLALVSREVAANRVRLVWDGAQAGAAITLYRRHATETWRPMATLVPDGMHRVTFEDHDVIAGETLEYRLGVAGARGEEFFGATEVQVPVSTLSLTPRVTNGHIAFAIELPSGAPASVALYDIAGRRVWSRTLVGAAPRDRDVTVDGAQLPQGVYFARLAQGRESRTARVALTR